jgi:hypothetical protein
MRSRATRLFLATALFRRARVSSKFGTARALVELFMALDARVQQMA